MSQQIPLFIYLPGFVVFFFFFQPGVLIDVAPKEEAVGWGIEINKLTVIKQLSLPTM